MAPGLGWRPIFHIQHLSLNYCSTTSITNMDLALQQLALQEKPNITATAKQYGVSRTTLSRRFRGVQSTRESQYDNLGLLSHQQERDLVAYIKNLTRRGLPPTPQMVTTFAFDISKQWPSRHWCRRFVKRWANELESAYLQPIDALRQRADSYTNYKAYFDLLHEKMLKYQVETHNIYNMDEKGFLIGMLHKAKRIFAKSAIKNGTLLGPIQDGSREWITVLATICGDGTALPPALIYKATTGNLQDS